MSAESSGPPRSTLVVQGLLFGLALLGCLVALLNAGNSSSNPASGVVAALGLLTTAVALTGAAVLERR